VPLAYSVVSIFISEFSNVFEACVSEGCGKGAVTRRRQFLWKKWVVGIQT